MLQFLFQFAITKQIFIIPVIKFPTPSQDKCPLRIKSTIKFGGSNIGPVLTRVHYSGHRGPNHNWGNSDNQLSSRIPVDFQWEVKRWDVWGYKNTFSDQTSDLTSRYFWGGLGGVNRSIDLTAMQTMGVGDCAQYPGYPLCWGADQDPLPQNRARCNTWPTIITQRLVFHCGILISFINITCPCFIL